MSMHVKSRLKQFVARYENMPISFGLWISVALFIVYVRDGIECLISTDAFAVADAFHLLHVPIFFISLLLSLIVILHLFSGTEIRKVSKIALVVFSIIIFPVVLDIIFSFFAKTDITYGYIQDHFWLNLVRFFDPGYTIPALPLSIRLEIVLVTLIGAGYIYLKRKNVFISLAGAVSVYLLCCLYGSVPVLLIEFLKLTVFIINFLGLKHFPLRGGVIDENIVVLLQLFVTSLLAAVWLRRYDRGKFSAIIKNIRPMRSAHYILLCLLGVLIHSLNSPIADFFMYIRIAGACLSLLFAFQFSVVINDVFDVACERISNTPRPLVTGTVGQREYMNIGYVCLSLSLLVAFWVNDLCVMVVLLFIALNFLYSVPPLRLKRFFPLSAFILGLQAVLAFAAGEAALATNDPEVYFNTGFFGPLFIIFSLGSTIKDLRDVEGDRQTGIATLPVLLGAARGRTVTAFLVCLSYCLVPYFLRVLFPQARILIISVCFALASFIYIRRKEAREWMIFLGYFVYIGLLVYSIASQR